MGSAERYSTKPMFSIDDPAGAEVWRTSGLRPSSAGLYSVLSRGGAVGQYTPAADATLHAAPIFISHDDDDVIR